MLIYLVRHGITAWNVEGRCQGSTDIPLNDEGLAQAEALAERFAALPLDAVYTSALCRAGETGKIIAKRHGLQVTSLAEFNELFFGDLEGVCFAGEGKGAKNIRDAWEKKPLETAHPSGESFQSLQKRVLEGLDKALDNAKRERHENVLIAAHCFPVKVILCWALDLPLLNMTRFRIGNASASCVEVTDDLVRVAWLNDRTHLGK